MQSLNKYKVTHNNEEVKYVEAHDYEFVGSAIVFTKNKTISVACFAGVYKEKILAISGAEIASIELIEDGDK